MTRTIFVMSLGFGALALTAQNAFSQRASNCAPREVVVQKLTDQWGETRRSVGLGRGNRMFEVFASDETGTWTIVATLPSGVACIMADGTDFEELARQTAGEAL